MYSASTQLAIIPEVHSILQYRVVAMRERAKILGDSDETCELMEDSIKLAGIICRGYI